MGNEKPKEYVKLNSAASPCSPSLNFFVVHQRRAGLPCTIHKAFAFCFLPSRQAAILRHQMEEVPVCGMGGRASGKEHHVVCSFALIYVKVHFYQSVRQPNVKFAGASLATVLIPGTRSKLQLQKPCCNDLALLA